MRVLVFLEWADDVRLPPSRDRLSGRVRSDWQVRRLDPAAARALDLALAFKETCDGAEVSALLVGPEADDPVLVEAAARGCGRAIRVWDEGCREARAPGKAVILSAAARAAGFDLILAGASSLVAASGQVGILTAAHLSASCVTQVTTFSASAEGSPAKIRASRALAGGFQEEVETTLPAVLTVLPGELDTTPAPLPALLEAGARPVPEWTLADLGVPLEHLRRADGPLVFGRLRTPKPPSLRVAAPDPASPAFERISGLVRGSVRRREGRQYAGTAEEVADKLFETLRDGGWLDHLRDR